MPRDVYKDGKRVRLPDQSTYGKPHTARYEYRAVERVPLTDPDFFIDKGLFVYDEEPLVESGLDNDGPLFGRLGKCMLVGIEYAMRQIHLFARSILDQLFWMQLAVLENWAKYCTPSVINARMWGWISRGLSSGKRST